MAQTYRRLNKWWFWTGLAVTGIGPTLVTVLPDNLKVLGWAVSVIGVVLMASSHRKVPAESIEGQWWKERADFRNGVQSLYEAVTPAWPAYNWQEIVGDVEWPIVDEECLGRALKYWHHDQYHKLKKQQSRDFWGMCQAIYPTKELGDPGVLSADEVSNLTRIRRDLYTQVGIWADRMDNDKEFHTFAHSEIINRGHREVVMLLAYLEIALAARVMSSDTPNNQGFWRLGKEWAVG